MSVSCEFCVLSGRGLCNELITRPEESYRLWCVVVCDQETPRMRRRWASAPQEKESGIYLYRILCLHNFYLTHGHSGEYLIKQKKG